MNQSKFGIPISAVDKLVDLCRQHNVKVVGLHAHTGSGILKETENWVEVAQLLYTLLSKVSIYR
jgi:diaminopimelate decarboxylase/aspartate kinase